MSSNKLLMFGCRCVMIFSLALLSNGREKFFLLLLSVVRGEQVCKKLAVDVKFIPQYAL